MNLLRTDKEVALNDLLVASRETVDHYQDAVEYLNDDHITPVLRMIMQERQGFIQRIEQAIRALGDLPSVPDPDRETGEMLLHHVTAALSSDTATQILEQRINAQRALRARRPHGLRPAPRLHRRRGRIRRGQNHPGRRPGRTHQGRAARS